MTSQNEEIIIAVILVIVGLVGAIIALRVLFFLVYVLLFFGGYIVRAISWIGKIISIPLGIFLGVNTYREFYFLDEISHQKDVKIILSIGIWIVSIYLISFIAYKIAKKITEGIQEETGWFKKKAASNSNDPEKIKEEHAMKSEHLDMIKEMKKMTFKEMEKYVDKIREDLIYERKNYSLDKDSYHQIESYLESKIQSTKRNPSENKIYREILFHIASLLPSISVDALESKVDELESMLNNKRDIS